MYLTQRFKVRSSAVRAPNIVVHFVFFIYLKRVSMAGRHNALSLAHPGFLPQRYLSFLSPNVLNQANSPGNQSNAPKSGN